MPTAARRGRKASVAARPSKLKSKSHLPDPKNATGVRTVTLVMASGEKKSGGALTTR